MLENSQGRYTKVNLPAEIHQIMLKAQKEGYLISVKDFFALGYMAGKYDLKSFENIKDLRRCVEAYDQKDDLTLLDTIGETLMDLGFLPIG